MERDLDDEEKKRVEGDLVNIVEEILNETPKYLTPSTSSNEQSETSSFKEHLGDKKSNKSSRNTNAKVCKPWKFETRIFEKEDLSKKSFSDSTCKSTTKIIKKETVEKEFQEDEDSGAANFKMDSVISHSDTSNEGELISKELYDWGLVQKDKIGQGTYNENINISDVSKSKNSTGRNDFGTEVEQLICEVSKISDAISQVDSCSNDAFCIQNQVVISEIPISNMNDNTITRSSYISDFEFPKLYYFPNKILDEPKNEILRKQPLQDDFCRSEAFHQSTYRQQKKKRLWSIIFTKQLWALFTGSPRTSFLESQSTSTVRYFKYPIFLPTKDDKTGIRLLVSFESSHSRHRFLKMKNKMKTKSSFEHKKRHEWNYCRLWRLSAVNEFRGMKEKNTKLISQISMLQNECKNKNRTIGEVGDIILNKDKILLELTQKLEFHQTNEEQLHKLANKLESEYANLKEDISLLKKYASTLRKRVVKATKEKEKEMNKFAEENLNLKNENKTLKDENMHLHVAIARERIKIGFLRQNRGYQSTSRTYSGSSGIEESDLLFSNITIENNTESLIEADLDYPSARVSSNNNTYVNNRNGANQFFLSYPPPVPPPPPNFSYFNTNESQLFPEMRMANEDNDINDNDNNILVINNKQRENLKQCQKFKRRPKPRPLRLNTSNKKRGKLINNRKSPTSMKRVMFQNAISREIGESSNSFPYTPLNFSPDNLPSVSQQNQENSFNSTTSESECTMISAKPLKNVPSTIQEETLVSNQFIDESDGKSISNVLNHSKGTDKNKQLKIPKFVNLEHYEKNGKSCIIDMEPKLNTDFSINENEPSTSFQWTQVQPKQPNFDIKTLCFDQLDLKSDEGNEEANNDLPKGKILSTSLLKISASRDLENEANKKVSTLEELSTLNSQKSERILSEELTEVKQSKAEVLTSTHVKGRQQILKNQLKKYAKIIAAIISVPVLLFVGFAIHSLW